MRRVVSLWLPFWQTDRRRCHSCSGLPVETMSLLPDHPPRAFTLRRVRHRVLHADGPERITGEWWRRAGEVAAVRDYWTLENQEGRRFWLFRQGDGVDPVTGALA